MNPLSHFDEHGASRMVDTAAKPASERAARASGRVRMRPETLKLICDKSLAKGDALEVARLAGIMAAKQTPNLIPLCHPLPLASVTVELKPMEPDQVAIEATVKAVARTGVEMEALTAVSVAGLTLYDMCKAADKTMTIESVRLEEKHGGRSGSFVRPD